MDKILVIDDEKPTLSMFRLFLKAYGYEVLTAENGETGLLLFKREKPAIVFTDIKMPGLDGLTVLEKLKRLDSEVPVIVITGHGDQELTRQAMALNAAAFIHKPIGKEALDEALQAANSILQGNINR